ncbi:MAG: Hsp20/alpha crystallin family protein [Bacteroidia bacterium]|nr:Hsp20/alpha crystallin family protein [Bacteroidia bacterium]
MESMFSSFFGNDLLARDYAGYVPSVNITETEDSYSIEVSAPGFEKKDFAVQVEEGVLTISGEHRQENRTEDKHYVRKEFNYGSFTRSFNLADLVDEEKIDAKYENGILKIELPKNEKNRGRNLKTIKIN